MLNTNQWAKMIAEYPDPMNADANGSGDKGTYCVLGSLCLFLRLDVRSIEFPCGEDAANALMEHYPELINDFDGQSGYVINQLNNITCMNDEGHFTAATHMLKEMFVR